MKNLNLSRQKRLVFAAIAFCVFMFGGQATVTAQGKYKPGDRVECEVTGNPNGKYWEKGTVLEFRANDQPDGSWYRVKADSNKVEYYCKIEHIRPIAGGLQTKTENKVEKKEVTKEKTAVEVNNNPAGGDFIQCPVRQKQVRNGSRPDAELLKKIIRCAKGEKAVEESDEGAVKVDISAIQIGAPRPWSYSQDLGNAKPGTVVYPVKANYMVKTFYRTATEVEEGWIRIFNFYVNAFGEWQIGSEENVKSPKVKRIQK